MAPDRRQQQRSVANGQLAASGGPAKVGPLIQSVGRALDILEVLMQSGGPLSLKDIAQHSGLKVSTCHHLLGTLLMRGYVRQGAETRLYQLGNKMLELGAARSRQIDLIAIAMPVLQQLNEQTTEAVHLAVIEGYELATLAKLDSHHAVRVDSGVVGKAVAAHATATGKAIIAFWPEADLEMLIRVKGLTRFTGETICDAGALAGELARVRARGYAEDREEFQPGVICIGAPIRSHEERVVASLSCSTPLMRAREKDLRPIRESVLAAAAEISRQLGWIHKSDTGVAVPGARAAPKAVRAR